MQGNDSYVPVEQTIQLEHAACFVDAVKNPDAHAVHNKAPPIEYLPASQSAQALSAIRVPTIEMYEPAAQYVCVVQDDAAAAEYFPLVQSVHAVIVPPAPILPAVQSEHDLSTVVVHATV